MPSEEERHSPAVTDLLKGVAIASRQSGKSAQIMDKMQEAIRAKAQEIRQKEEDELEAIIISIPLAFRVRCREGNGPENKMASLALSVSKLAGALGMTQLQPMETIDKNARVLLRVQDKHGNRYFLDAHYSDGAPCPDATYPPHQPGWYYWDGSINQHIAYPKEGWLPYPVLPLPTRQELLAERT